MGEPLAALQAVLLAAAPDSPPEYDFSAPGQYPKYKERLSGLGAKMYGGMGIARGDTDLRATVSRQSDCGRSCMA